MLCLTPVSQCRKSVFCKKLLQYLLKEEGGGDGGFFSSTVSQLLQLRENNYLFQHNWGAGGRGARVWRKSGLNFIERQDHWTNCECQLDLGRAFQISLNTEINSTGLSLLRKVMHGRPFLLLCYSIRYPFLFLQNNQWWLIFQDFIIRRSFVPCGSAKKRPRRIYLHPNTNVTGQRRTSHINVSTFICCMP